MASFKGFHVCAIDSSIVEILNTKLTRKEFGIPEKTQPKYAVHWDIGMSWR